MLRRRSRPTVFALLLALGAASGGRASAAAPPLVHPIYAHLPDAPEDDALRRAFAAAAERYGLVPVEVADVPAPPVPRAPDLLKIAIINTQKLAFADALRDLDAAAAEVTTTGGAGLSTGDLSDLYLYRAIATARADWNATAAAPPTPERIRAYADYVRAATMAPGRTLNERELPPQALADFARAAEEVRQRARGTLLLRGSADAQVTLDGGASMPVAGGITFRDLVYGEHLIHVEEIGRAPWGVTLGFEQPSRDLDIPARAPLALDAATAAALARRMGARFALVAEPKGGPAAPVTLRLIDASGVERDSSLVPSAREAGLIDAAVMRLDEQARKIAQETPAGTPPPPPAAAPANLGPPILLAPAREKASFHDDPAAWARDHWPLLTAIGVVVLSSVVLSAAVGADR